MTVSELSTWTDRESVVLLAATGHVEVSWSVYAERVRVPSEWRLASDPGADGVGDSVDLRGLEEGKVWGLRLVSFSDQQSVVEGIDHVNLTYPVPGSTNRFRTVPVDLGRFVSWRELAAAGDEGIELVGRVGNEAPDVLVKLPSAESLQFVASDDGMRIEISVTGVDWERGRMRTNGEITMRLLAEDGGGSLTGSISLLPREAGA